MGIFDWITKKEEKVIEPVKAELPETLPEPPSIDKINLPEPMKTEMKSKLRFPKIPFKSSRKFENQAYESEKFNLEQREMLDVIQPLFIKGSQFRDIIMDVTDSKNELKKATDFSNKFDEIHELKELEFEKLRTNIETIQRKLIFMDKSLFK